MSSSPKLDGYLNTYYLWYSQPCFLEQVAVVED
jgi:hypothetical protein